VLDAIVRFAVRRRGLVIALALLFSLYGLYRITLSSLDIFPEFAGKRIVVQTEAPGLAAELVENLVTFPVERALAGLVGLRQLRSESIQGLSVIVAVFDDRSDLYRNRQLVGERLATVTGQLPAGAGPPILVPLSSSSATIMTLGLTSATRPMMELSDLVQWTLAPRLLAVPGVADVNVFGAEQRQLQIQVDPDKLWRYGIGINGLERSARQAASPVGLGFVENTNQRLSLQLSSGADVIRSLAHIVLLRSPQGNVTLGDIAKVNAAPKPRFSAAQIGETPAVLMMVIGQHGANTLRVSGLVDAVLAEFEPMLARQGIALHPRLFRPADYIQRSVSNLAGHLAIGAVLVIAVLGAFLFDLRAAAIAALAIPLSLLSAVTVLLDAGINLNIMVLGGLTIALGEVVDDAIIDTENIFRRLRENQHTSSPLPAWQVVYRASLEVRSSVVYASFIIALVFVPLLTFGGVAGRLFAPLGYTYILAVLMSLLTALTVTPALCYLLLDPERLDHRPPPLMRALQSLYRRLLGRVMHHPKATALGSLAACVGLLALTPGFGGEFLPKLREGHYIVHTATLPGTALAESIRIGSRLTERFRSLSGVESTSQWAGRAERGADTYGTHYSEYEVRLEPEATASGTRQQTILEGLRAVLADFPGVVFEANSFLTERIDETISGYTAPVVVNLYGTELSQLDDKARELAALIGSVPGAVDVQLRSQPGTPLAEVQLHPDQLASVGLQPKEVLDALQTAFAGTTVGRFFEGARAYDITTILVPGKRSRLEDLRELPLSTADGTLIPLRQIAEIRENGGRYNVLHQSAQRVQTVTCAVQGRDAQSFVTELRDRVLSELRFPPDTYPEFTGSAVEQAAARRELLAHSLLAGLGVLLLVYISIGSVRHVAITLLNLPFALAGGIAAAYLTGGTLSVGSMIGFVTLFGITVRNSIMLISHYRHLVGVEGLPWDAATALRGAQERLPSILMTALVTALAMLPIAIASDNPGREIMGPMASIIVGGLVSSTLLNLLVLPTVLRRWGRFDPNGGLVTED